MTIDVRTVAASRAAADSIKEPASANFDDRWAAWQVKRVGHERAVRRRMAIAAPILIVVAVVIYALLGR